MYYPKSQIKTNLFTNGNEYFLSTNGESYTGYYYKTSNGQVFSGKTPDDRPNILLEFISSTEWNLTEATENGRNFQQRADNFDGLVYDNQQQNPKTVNTYFSLKPENLNVIIPYYTSPTPTQQDYQIGEFRRYFCKKENEIIYIEISKTTYDLIIVKSPDILWQLYFPFNLPWQITGDKQQVARTNKNIVDLTSQRLRLPRFGDYLNNNYTKYFKFPNISNLYTSGGEFKTSDGQNYIGFYHIHDDRGPMVGATHTREPHGLLFPINEAIISEVTTQYNSQPMISTTGSVNVNMGTPIGEGRGY